MEPVLSMEEKSSVSADVSIKISISDTFDGGNIKGITTQPNENDPINTTDVILHIKPDIYTELEKIGHMQYFSFRATVNGLGFPPQNKKHKIRYVIANAEASSYPEAWIGKSLNSLSIIILFERSMVTSFLDLSFCSAEYSSNIIIFILFSLCQAVLFATLTTLKIVILGDETKTQFIPMGNLAGNMNTLKTEVYFSLIFHLTPILVILA